MGGMSGGRKNFGPRSVVCSVCKKRGVANLKIVGKKGPVICADCRRAGHGGEDN